MRTEGTDSDPRVCGVFGRLLVGFGFCGADAVLMVVFG